MTQKEIQDRFLAELPAPYGQQAADNTIPEWAMDWSGLHSNSDMYQLINRAFWWDKTKEGDDYWSDLADRADTKGVKMADYLGSFVWGEDEWMVRVWKNLVKIGCQTVSKENIQNAQNGEDFTNGHYKVQFNDRGLSYGISYSASKKDLATLFLKLDELGF